MRQIADERYYTELPGGVLEAPGRLFKRSVKMYVYLARDEASGEVVSVERAAVQPPWYHLCDLLLQIGRVVPLRDVTEEYLSIRTHPGGRCRVGGHGAACRGRYDQGQAPLRIQPA